LCGHYRVSRSVKDERPINPNFGFIGRFCLPMPDHRKLKAVASTLANYLDDLLVLLGCGLVLFGVYQTFPVAVPFVAGGMCIAWGWLLARAEGSR
jgi:hypothetical protein